MKLKLKMSILLLAGFAVMYSACKKSNNDPSTKTLSEKAVSSQIALNLAQTLYGGMGGFSVNDGLNAPANVANPRHDGRSLNSLNPDCDFKFDTTFNYDLSVDTAQATISGRMKFSTICNNDIVSGVNVYDSVSMVVSSPKISGTYKLGQNFILTAVDPQNEDSQLTLNGSLNMLTNMQYKTGSKSKSTESYNYVFSNITIDPMNDGDLAKGTATFHTKGETPGGKWDYQGTITFLGDHKVKIVINGTSYTVDLWTGQVS
jgi:hypothetical protein